MNVTPGRGPLYRQIREWIVARIVHGDWRPGDILPSEINLAAEFGVSQGTVRKAVDALVAENLVIRHQGKGTYVAVHTPHRELFHFFHVLGRDGAKPQPTTSQLISCRQRRAEKEDLGCLHLRPNARVVDIFRVRNLRDRPVILERVIVPSKLFQGLAESGDVPNELYQLFEKTYGVTIHKVVEEISAELATVETARYLDIKPGAPILAIERRAETLGGMPVEFRRSLCDSRDYIYSNEIV